MTLISYYLVQLLDEVCTKNGWGAPSYSLHSTSTAGGMGHSEIQLFLYHIRIPAMGVTFQPTKLSPNVDDAQRIAAEYCLMQLGYPMDCKLILCDLLYKIFKI